MIGSVLSGHCKSSMKPSKTNKKHAGKFSWKSDHEARPTGHTGAVALIKCVRTCVGLRPCTGTWIPQKKKKKDGAIDAASFDVPLLFWFEYCLDKGQNATSKTLQSLLHSLKTTIDEVLDSALLCLVCYIGRRSSMRAECWLCVHTFVLRRNSRWDSTTDAGRCGWSADYACTSSSYAKPISFTKKRPVGFDNRHSSRVDVGAGRGLLILACCIPSASLRKSYLLREKTADQVVRGLKVKLKTSPTKVRLASLKKIWKQADRRHERRDVAVAESADFAPFDLRNRTSLDGHSNTYRTGFHLAGSMPNSDDVRRREIPKKSLEAHCHGNVPWRVLKPYGTDWCSRSEALRSIHLSNQPHRLNPLSTDFSASRRLKFGLRTHRAISQQLQALPPRSTHLWKGLLIAHPTTKSITKNLFKRLRYIVLSEGSRLPRTETENPIVLLLWSSYEVRSFASRQLGSLPSFAVYISRRFKLP